MLMRNVFRALSLALPLMAGACSHVDKVPEPPRIAGDSPRDIASSIARLKSSLPAEKRAEFSHAIMTLALVSPDKSDDRTVGYMTPHFSRMVVGRDAEQIIQLAALYRASIPMGRR